VDHLQARFASEANGSGKLTLNWEAQAGAGEQDFNDAVLTVTGLKQASATTGVFNYEARATDVDGDTLTYSLTQAPVGATLNSQTGFVNWTPSAAGSYSFTITADDGKGGVSSQTFTVMVAAALKGANAPLAGNASYVVEKDGSIRIDLSSLAIDANGDALTFSAGNPARGTLTRNADGSYTYRPGAGYTGADSFTYTASDGKLSSTGTISLSVKASASSSASITVTSAASLGSGTEQEIHYVVINSGAASAAASSAAAPSALTVNWAADSASELPTAVVLRKGDDWLSELLKGSAADEEDLASQTGLRVKL
jgi:hypothetical protein